MDADARQVFETRLGWTFRDHAVLRQALSHRSWCAEHPEDASNERLEFLGDAVLGIVVTDHIYRNYPQHQEGELAKVRASVVNAEVLAEVAADIALGPCLLLGKGEDGSGGREKPSILADAMEAVIAGVYLDGGMGAAWDVVLRLFTERITEAATGPGGDDYKTRLQELAAQRFDRLPRYQVRDGAARRPAVRQRRGRIEEAGRAGRGSGRVGTGVGGRVADRGRGGAGCLSSLRWK